MITPNQSSLTSLTPQASVTANSQNFLDINGLNSIRQQSKETDKGSKDAALQTAAKQFEAIFMQMLMKSMRKAQDVLESDSPFNSESTKFYRDMHDQQMSLELSNNGSLGLSDLIVRQLGGDTESFTPQSFLQSDNRFSKSNGLLSEDNNKGKSIVDTGILISAEDRQTNDSGDRSTNNRQSLFDMPQRAPSSSNTVNSLDNKPSVYEMLAMQEPQYQQPKDFVMALTEDAKRVEEKLNIPFEVVIAQAALETGWGQKIIKTESGQSSNNLFNIKADKRWDGDKINKETLEFEQGAMVKKREPFRVYETISDSVNDYMQFLSNSERYKNALDKAGDVEHFLHNLQSAGYATDPKYAEKIKGTLRTVTSLLNK
ncbi:flagellar assembly peptidoglycan hydrolase FlgJ [Colwellia sp. BRX9-1]|uniref:flagellar assembly peptidoglycan hydrolase FlgJ n=1 Tax=Colwellia sp. BRX9-1 TaxID=2759830 RepID=UPI0015F4B681|nr:flagellar assembly peptidoglycan hydrolase FlgJ [Colwellia sp. BRX9-1]MBA6350883.1 flagellar assembly peptidoglycan hydrolase FlgJ [Colwellia sp. BRX9-1]